MIQSIGNLQNIPTSYMWLNGALLLYGGSERITEDGADRVTEDDRDRAIEPE